jgi:exonuclease III
MQPVGQQYTKPVLRLASHNVHGLRAHVAQLAQVWLDLRLDVVFVQENWLTFFQASQVVAELNIACRQLDCNHAGFEAVWALNTAANGNRSAGVVVLVRKALLTSGAATLASAAVQTHPGGRMVVVPLQWGGHSLRLVCVYMPNDSTGQQEFMQQDLQPVLDGQSMYVLGGDFNFVESVQLDRTHTGQQNQPSMVPAQVLRQVAPGGIDVFRALHPTRKAYTHHAHASAARLDRFYVPEQLLPYAMQCMVGGETPSDHRPVVLQLAARSSIRQGKGLYRVRMQHIASDPEARAQLQQFAADLASQAPQDDAPLLAWYPSAKAKLLQHCMTFCVLYQGQQPRC